MIYIFAFCVAMMFAHFAGKTRSGRKLRVRFLSLLCILSLSLLGGLRAASLGTDVTVYVLPHFNYARMFNNLFGFLTHFNNNTGQEPLYRAIVYFVSRFTPNVNWLLFTFQFLTVMFVYIGAYRYKDKASLPFIILLWSLMYYNDSYNLVRQHLAMAIVFAGFWYIEAKKYKRFLAYVLFASLIHSSAIVCVTFILIHSFLYVRKTSNKQFRKLLLVAGVTITCLCITQIVQIGILLGLIPTKYGAYLGNSSGSSRDLETLLYFVEVIVLLTLPSRIRARNSMMEYYKVNAYTLFILLFLTSTTFFYGNRICMYFGIINLHIVSQLPRMSREAETRVLLYMVITILFFVYWLYVYVYGGVSMTYPYKFLS